VRPGGPSDFLEKRKDHAKESGIITLLQEVYFERHRRPALRLKTDFAGAIERWRCSMSKFLAILATLKPTLIAASAAAARGEMLSVILISALFSLVQLAAKPVSGVGPPMVSSSDDHGLAYRNRSDNHV
jgi:hypothetical protein